MLKVSEIMLDLTQKLSTKQLLEAWNETEKQVISIELFLVREALMTVFEQRFPVAYDKWMGAECDPKHPEKDKPEYYFN